MALVKVGEDSWNLDPPTVTSILQFSARDFASNTGDTFTSCCGMGWRFKLSRRVTTFSDPLAVLHFDPFFPQSISSQNLKIQIKILGDVSSMPFSFGVPSKVEKPYTYTVISSKATEVHQFAARVDARIEVKVHFSPPAPSIPTPPSVPTPTPAVKYPALIAASVQGRDLIDIVFYLHSARSRSKSLWNRPRPVYGSTALLKGHCSYLDTLLFDNGFREASSTNIPSSMTEYDYDSDSDFESDSEDDSVDKDPKVNTSMTSPPHQDVFQPMPDNVNMKDQRGLARSIPLTSFAFRTWRAFILNLEVETITFKPLRSQQKGTPANLELACSPKSMYRLADMVGLENLKKKAFSQICSSVSQENVMAELFSSFTSRYAEVQSFEIKFLLQCPNKMNEFCQKLAAGHFVEHQVVVAEIFRAKLKIG